MWLYGMHSISKICLLPCECVGYEKKIISEKEIKALDPEILSYTPALILTADLITQNNFHTTFCIQLDDFLSKSKEIS